MVAKHSVDAIASEIASAIGEPSRAKILYCLMDERARTATELAAIAEIGASTASAHLERLRSARLVRVTAQGKHRYYSLAGPEVAQVLEGLSVIAGITRPAFVPNTPAPLRAARTCYDHIAGSLGVALHDRMLAQEWIRPGTGAGTYTVTPLGARKLAEIGVASDETGSGRRKLAYPCLDWSERRSHLGGRLGAGLLSLALKRKWLIRDLEGRALTLTRFGRSEFARHFGLKPSVL